MNLAFEISNANDMRVMYACTSLNGTKITSKPVFINKLTEMDTTCSMCLADLVKSICKNTYRQRAYTLETLRERGAFINTQWTNAIDVLRVLLDTIKNVRDFSKIHGKLYSLRGAIMDLMPPKHSPLYPTYAARILFLEELLLKFTLPFNYTQFIVNQYNKPKQMYLNLFAN